MHHVLDAGLLEDYDTTTSFSPTPNREYCVDRTSDEVRHHEIARDAAGVIYDQAVPVQYAIGSGKRGRSYVIDRDGLLFMSPISWYTEETRWDLSPMYAVTHNPRFERRVTSRCVSCHAGRSSPAASGKDRFRTPPFAELSIGCERCHGPGEKHVARHRGNGDDSGLDPIVNPSRLDPARRDSVCHQCHLQGADVVLRYGRTDFDFRPGMHLGEIWSVFLDPSETQSDGTTTAVSQVEQMLESRCAQQSDGRLGCVSCHDPHGIPSETERVEFYRSRCVKCHASESCREMAEKRQAADGDSCIACHMPRLAASDVPHTTQTDHRIARGMGVRHEKSSTGGDFAWQVFEQRMAPLSAIEERRARGIVRARQAERTQDAFAAVAAVNQLRGVLPSAADDIKLLDALAIAEFVTGDRSSAVKRWRDILKLDETNESALHSLGIVAVQAGDLSDAERCLTRLTAINSGSATLFSELAQVQAAQGRWDAAIMAAVRGAELDPSRSVAHEWLADAFARKGDRARSQNHRRIAQRLRAVEIKLETLPR
jgi:Flp pilus assembly protein TadD